MIQERDRHTHTHCMTAYAVLMHSNDISTPSCSKKKTISTTEYLTDVGSIVNQARQQHLKVTEATVVTLRNKVVCGAAHTSLFDLTTFMTRNLLNLFYDT